MVLDPLNMTPSDAIVVASAAASAAIMIVSAVSSRGGRRAGEVVGARLQGLREGYPGSLGEPSRASLPGMEPRGLEGLWTCWKLGCGGWGCSYLCSRAGESVAVKVPRGYEALVEGGSPPTVSEGLTASDEVSVVSRLRHPHLLKLIGYSKLYPILVYEYAEQGTLQWQLNMGWRPGEATVAVMGAQLADAVRYMHDRGVIHGDIKPSNIFFSGGLAKLGDFSSVKVLLSTSGWGPSTPGFRAPEQVFSDLARRSSERGVQNRVDIYQLAATLVYTLTGRTLDGSQAVDPGGTRRVLSRVRSRLLRGALEEMLKPDPVERASASEAFRLLERAAVSLS